MSTTKSTNKAIGDRIKKAKYALIGVRRKILYGKNLRRKLRINLLNALIGSVLLYGLHITRHTNK